MTRWSIRTKLLIGLALLVVIVATLSWGGIHGLYAYRGLVRGLNRRVAELPHANVLIRRAHDLRVAFAKAPPPPVPPAPDSRDAVVAARAARAEFRNSLIDCRDALRKYREKLADNPDHAGLNDSAAEWQVATTVAQTLNRLQAAAQSEAGPFDPRVRSQVAADVERLCERTASLPGYLHQTILDHTDDDSAKSQYRKLIVLAWITSITTAIVFALLVQLFYRWLFRPLRVLIKGSRKVAAGNFDYRIRLDTRDEMAELADAMNDMTARFRDIRDDLDRQVRERTRQVVRSEQLASVGFLAAGVAHEINNPLASIAMCAESLEGRIDERAGGIHADSGQASRGQADPLFKKYLRTIQDEAFRCKEITEKLLDFSRLGEVKRQPAELRSLVAGVVDMLGRLGKYQGKRIEFLPGPSLSAPVNNQQIKQVALNLLANALDSVAAEGLVTIELQAERGYARLTVSDNGCGMTPEVLEHLFEPFFTRRRGGQGTGLGLSIVYSIVADHDGTIEAASPGPNRGSQFCVRLPLTLPDKETSHRRQAA